MATQEEDRLMQRVMEDSKITHDERKMAGPRGRDGPLCGRRPRHPRADGGRPGGRVPYGSGWPAVQLVVHSAEDDSMVNWCPTPPRSPERDASPREEVLQAPVSFQPAPAQHGPRAHLWTPPGYVDLVSDDDDTDGH
uniref:Uncharacterized protein n=1 Tax=Hordeum vulgare subsp. vulgare TaxID=112509 RepID=A0A8I6XNE9_HORVV